MQRQARLVLRRINKRGKRVRTRVSVQRITLGGFLELVRALAPKVAKVLTEQADRNFTDLELLGCADMNDLSAFADMVCVGRPVGFLKKWCSNAIQGTPEGELAFRNTMALLAASRAAEGDGQWTRFIGCLNRTPEKTKGKGGGLTADALMLSGMLPNMSYTKVLDMPLQDFLNVCDAINVSADQERKLDPLSDPDAEPMDSIGIPGLFEVH